MFDLDKWQEIYYTIQKNKLRTALTAFAVAWGIFMLVVLLGAGKGLQNGVEFQFSEDAVNNIYINPGTTSKPYNGIKPGKKIIFHTEDFENVNANTDGIQYSTARNYLGGSNIVRYGKKFSAFEIVGVHPGQAKIENAKMVNGRFINVNDVDRRRKVAAIGTGVADILFGKIEDPVGKYIDVNRTKYLVVGVYVDPGGEEEVKNIYIPLTTSQMVKSVGTRINNMVVNVNEEYATKSNEIVEQTLSLLSEKHNFDPTDKRAVFVWDNAENYQQFANLFIGIQAFLWLVGIGTIIAGIVGVSNIMLIVVKERTREIGVRKALGATPNSIIGLILQESIVITMLAGYLGLVLGIGVIELANFAIESSGEPPEFFRNPSVELSTAISATLMLVAAGALAGYFPARKAAKVDPIVALRDE
jgi:putative ABC transport system permease protein